MASETVQRQTNLRYDVDDITSMSKLAIEFNSSLEGMFQVAIKHFLKAPKAEKKKVCATATKKKMGRPIKL